MLCGGSRCGNWVATQRPQTAASRKPLPLRKPTDLQALRANGRKRSQGLELARNENEGVRRASISPVTAECRVRLPPPSNIGHAILPTLYGGTGTFAAGLAGTAIRSGMASRFGALPALAYSTILIFPELRIPR
jgi:hypothetical protein